MKSLIFIFLVILSSNIVPQDKSTTSNSLNKTTTNDDYDYIAINQMKMWVSNNGSGATQYSIGSVFWPGGENATIPLIFDDGLIWGGFIETNLIVGGNKYYPALQPGKILNNRIPDDPSLSKYRIYKIRKGWEDLPNSLKRDKYRRNYEEWPVNDGAPFFDADNTGFFNSAMDKPLFLGDESLWCVMNDLRPKRYLSPDVIGLEIQMSVYGYVHPSLQDVLFKKYLIINKSQNLIHEMYFSYFSDSDLGNNTDDYVGCDTLLNLAYCYNADNDDDGGYGENPPAVGYLLLQGTTMLGTLNDSARVNNRWRHGIKDQKMTSFSTNPYEDSFWPICDRGNVSSDSVIESFTYNCLKGDLCDGSPHINPIDGIITKYPFSGNPVDSTGWNMGYHNLITPENRNMYLNTGPITMAPGDTQEVVIAIIASRGSNNLQSISVLKNAAKIVKYFYDNYTPELADINYQPPIPEFYYLSQNYPNPFNPSTNIIYELPLPGLVTLKVFDLLGQEIRTLINEEKSAGKYEVEFSLDRLSSGIYFYTLTSRAYSKTKKMILLK